MAKQGISTGTTPNDGTGDSLLDGAIKINENFDELYTLLGDGTTLSVGVVTSLTAGNNINLSSSSGSVTISVTGISTNDIDTNRLVVSGVSTLGSTIIGGGTTELVVNGDARVTGILTVGSSSITLDGTTNIAKIGTGVTIYGSTGIVSATKFYSNGIEITGGGTIIYEGATLYNAWQKTSVGIHTLSNVGIGTTNATSKLTVKGNTSLETLNVSGVSTFNSRLTISKNTETEIGGIELRVVSGISDGKNDGIFFTQTGIGTVPLGSIRCEYKTNGRPDFGIYTRDENVGGIATESQKLIIKNNGFIGIGTTNPTSALTVGAVGSSTTSLTVNGYANINGANVITWPDATDTRQSIYIGQGSGSTLAGGYYNVALGTRALEECGLGDNSNIAIGYEALRYGGGGQNIVIGANAADSSSFSGNANVVIGHNAGTAMTGAFSNTLIGYESGDSITTGDNNIFIGRNSGASITTGNRNVIIGEYDGTGAVANSEFPGYYGGSLNLATSTAHIVIADGYGTVKIYINPEGNVGIATTNPTSKLTVGGDANISGVVTATAFVGDGSGLTGLNVVGTGISVFDSSSLIGVATAINFGTNLSVSAVSAGLVTVTATGGGGGGESYWASTAAGIHTLSNVGIATTNPQTPLQVENVYGIKTGSGTFTASAGVAHTADSYGVSDFVNAEYTLFFQHSSGIQSQKVLVMDDGVTAYSQEYGIMNSSDLLVSVGATVKSGNVELWWTPETGVTGIVTYRYTRETMI